MFEPSKQNRILSTRASWVYPFLCNYNPSQTISKLFETLFSQ